MEQKPKNPNYPDGILVFPPNANAPEYSKGKIIIKLKAFSEYVKENPDKIVDFVGRDGTKVKQLVLDVNQSQNSNGGQEQWYCKTNTWTPDQANQKPQASQDDDDLFG